MDTMSRQIHSRRAANGIIMFRGAVMAGLLASTLLTTLPSVTFANGRDGDRRDDKGRHHSLVQHPFNARNPLVTQQATVQATIDALTAKVDQLMIDNTSLRSALAAAQGNISTMQGTVNTMQGTVDTMKVSVEALDKKAADIIPDLGKYVKINTDSINGLNGPHILVTGANVHVRNGSGATNSNVTPFAGLGNLIVGYNENTTPTPTLPRAGSHNLVGGSMHSFNSVGGMVFGLQNTLNGQYASVLGGSVNTATGPNSTVYGGSGQAAVNQNSYAPQAARPTSGN